MTANFMIPMHEPSDTTIQPLRVEEWGSGQPVVLLHSSGLSGRQWRRLATTAVSRGFRAVVPEFTGHGTTEAWPEPRPFTFHTDVARLGALLETLGPSHVVGHSYGGLIALQAGIARPKLFRSLTLFEPVAFGTLDPARDEAARATLGKVDFTWGESAADHERWLQSFVDFWNGEGGWASLREEARVDFRRVGWVLREGVMSLGLDQTPASAYRVIGCPTLLLTGEKSPIAAGTVVRRLAEVLPNARVVTIEGAGHMAPLSHADRVNEAILAFLAAS